MLFDGLLFSLLLVNLINLIGLLPLCPGLLLSRPSINIRLRPKFILQLLFRIHPIALASLFLYGGSCIILSNQSQVISFLLLRNLKLEPLL